MRITGIGFLAVGQSQMNVLDASTVSRSTTGHVSGVTVAAGKLIVTDESNHRILVWNQIPHAHGAPADLVLGQADFTSHDPNRGGAVSEGSMNHPLGAWSDGTRLAVADGDNHRVLIWNTFPTGNGQNADLVLGQTSLTTATDPGATPTATSISRASLVEVVDGKLIVSDKGFSRLLIWNAFPTANGQAASVVVGQPNMTTSVPGAGANGLNGPAQVAWDGEHLWVADTDNNRVVRYSGIPTSDGEASDVVLGQPDFDTTTSGSSQATMNGPWGIATVGAELYVADSLNNRVLAWDSLPLTNGDNPDAVYGQNNFSSSGVVNPPVYESTIASPRELHFSNGTLIRAEYGNSRAILGPH